MRPGEDIYGALGSRALWPLLIIAFYEEAKTVSQLHFRAIAWRAADREVVANHVNVKDVLAAAARGNRDSARLEIISLHQRVRIPSEK